MINPISYLLNVLCCANDSSSKGDVDDSNVDAVIARNLWKNHRILPPSSKFKQNWDLVMVRARTPQRNFRVSRCAR